MSFPSANVPVTAFTESIRKTKKDVREKSPHFSASCGKNQENVRELVKTSYVMKSHRGRAGRGVVLLWTLSFLRF